MMMMMMITFVMIMTKVMMWLPCVLEWHHYYLLLSCRVVDDVVFGWKDLNDSTSYGRCKYKSVEFNVDNEIK